MSLSDYMVVRKPEDAGDEVETRIVSTSRDPITVEHGCEDCPRYDQRRAPNGVTAREARGMQGVCAWCGRDMAVVTLYGGELRPQEALF